MKIIQQSHQIEWPGPHQVELWDAMMLLIESAGRTCYKSRSDKEEGWEQFIRKIIKRGHMSVVEHGNVTVRFITDRGVTHESVRHRLAAYSQESTRFCDYSAALKEEFTCGTLADFCVTDGDGCEFIEPVDFDLNYEDLDLLRMIEEHYNMRRLKDGLSPQQARYFLPNGLKTEIVMTANLREWLHVLQLRTAQAAHPQIRFLMWPLLTELREHLPLVFKDIGE